MYREYGFVAPRSQLTTTAEEAAYAATLIGYPVVMKVVSPNIIHKTDVGGVITGVRNETEAMAAFARIMTAVKSAYPDAQVDGIVVEEMIQQGVEIIIGLNNDPQFGPTIMFGLGGVLTEILHDVSFRVLPITRKDAVAMIDEIAGKRILEGYRRQQPVSREMLVDLLVAAAHMGTDLGPELDSVDFNPILVWGNEHRVLDVKILRRSQPLLFNQPHSRTPRITTGSSMRDPSRRRASSTPAKSATRSSTASSIPITRGRSTRSTRRGTRSWASKHIPHSRPSRDSVDLVVVHRRSPVLPALLRGMPSEGIPQHGHHFRRRKRAGGRE